MTAARAKDAGLGGGAFAADSRLGSSGVWGCVALSIALHLLLLSQSIQPVREATSARTQPLPMAARLVAAPSRSESVLPRTASQASDAAPSVHRQRAARPESDRASPIASTRTRPQELAKPETPSLPGSLPSADDGYVPRPLLTQAPVALTTVVIASPHTQAPAGLHTGVLSLYIDEDGRVQHVAGDELALPPELEQAAREAFMAALFSPGQIDGRVVKSRLRVEVVFDTTPLPTIEPAAVSTSQ